MYRGNRMGRFFSNYRVEFSMSNRFFIFLGLVLAVNCSPRVCCETVTLDRFEMFTQRTPLREVYRVPSDSVLAVTVRKGVICSFFQKQQNRYALVLSDFTGHEIASLVEYGSQPQQVLIAKSSYGSGKFLLHDPITKKIVVTDIADAQSLPGYVPQVYHTDILSQEVIPMDDRLLFLNPNSFQEMGPRVLISDRRWNTPASGSHKASAFSATMGSLLYNSSGKSIVYFSQDEPIIEFFDKACRLTRQIEFPHERGTVMMVPHDGIVEYAYQGIAPKCFISADGNEDYMAAVFRTDEGKSFVLVFDWEGTILDGFEATATVKTISLAKTSVYCWENEGEQSCLREYPFFIH